MEKLLMEVMVILLVEEGYEVDVKRETELREEAGCMVEDCCMAKDGAVLWRVVCEDYRVEAEEKDDEDTQEVAATLVRRETEEDEVEAEHLLDLSRMDIELEV